MSAALAPRLESLPAESRDRKIIDLCRSAINDLNEASSLEDVLGIRNAAEAFATYTRKWKCAVEAQANTQLVVLLAEARIGAELTAAQARGEVATQEAGRPISVRAADTSAATLTDIGIPRQRAAEYKQLAAAGEAAIREEVADAIAENRRPSRERVIQRARPNPRAAIPSIAERPSDLTQFVLWLRTGAALVEQLGDADRTAARLAEHRMTPPQSQIGVAADFLSALQRKMA